MTQPDGDLFDDRRALVLAPGAILLGAFVLDVADALLAAIDAVAVAAPFRHLETPGGKRMSVAMTNAGALGWVSDRSGRPKLREVVNPVNPCAGNRRDVLLRDCRNRSWSTIVAAFRAPHR